MGQVAHYIHFCLIWKVCLILIQISECHVPKTKSSLQCALASDAVQWFVWSTACWIKPKMHLNQTFVGAFIVFIFLERTIFVLSVKTYYVFNGT